ncbi:serine hydrolase domain-containing protein [Novosphingobium lindaniclasticum]
MSAERRRLEARIDRRSLLHMAGLAGIGAALMPHLAWAAEQDENLPRVRALVERWIGSGLLPGMVASLGQPGREPEFVTRGAQGFNDSAPITADSLFRIYSMTKPVTGIMAMDLIAQGRLGLDQPLHEILPRFAQMKVQDRYDGSLAALHPAPRAITIRHLLTHTSGLGYSIVQTGPIRELMQAKGLAAGQVSRFKVPGFTDAAPAPSLAAFADRLAEVPLVYDPATHWSYSLGLDLMGRVIEVVTGRPFDAYLREALFEPAGMASTAFQVPKTEAKRLTTNYAALGKVLVPIDEPGNSVFLDTPAFPFGGSGLVSTPRDYDRFLRLLAQRGTIDGRRVLAESAVETGTADLLPPGVAFSAMLPAGSGFGAGGRVGKGAENGLFGWAGAAGTVGMVDMIRGLRSQLFVQFMPPNAFDLIPQFQTALKADVMALLAHLPETRS